MSKLQARNEAIINAPCARIWDVITDIERLHKINPGVLSASGRMDTLHATRTCTVSNKGKQGTMTERLIELLPEKKTVWTIENDTMGMSKMLKETRFVFHLERISDTRTKVINESYYQPANFLAAIMNLLVMKTMIRKAQEQILTNIKSLTEV